MEGGIIKDDCDDDDVGSEGCHGSEFSSCFNVQVRKGHQPTKEKNHLNFSRRRRSRREMTSKENAGEGEWKKGRGNGSNGMGSTIKTHPRSIKYLHLDMEK